MPSQEEIREQLDLLAAHRRTLTVYLKQYAQLGSSHVPPGVVNGIAESRDHIKRVKNILISWGISVEHHPDDEPFESQSAPHSQKFFHEVESTTPMHKPTSSFDQITTNMKQILAGDFYDDQWIYQGSGYVSCIKGEIQISTHKGEILLWSKKITNLEDMSYSVNAHLVSGSTKLGFGLVFWLHDPSNYYHFAIQTGGRYRLIRYLSGEPDTLVPWATSPRIKGVLRDQRIGVITKGKNISLFVENTRICSYDVDRKSAGRIGLYVESPGLTAEFRDIDIREPRNMK